MVGVAVPLALAVGFGLGVLGAKSRRANAVLQPALDLMQTIPTFAYLAPLVVLFGFGPVPGVLASMIYAAPPMTRNVMLGLSGVPQELREVSSMSGTTAWQRFRFIEMPCAKQCVDLGSIPYSAVIQPLPEFLNHGGNLVSTEAVHKT